MNCTIGFRNGYIAAFFIQNFVSLKKVEKKIVVKNMQNVNKPNKQKNEKAI